MFTILIVCTGNTCRSPMAEALLRDMIALQGMSHEITVASAGLAVWGQGAASTGACSAMAGRGLNLASHYSQQLTPDLAKDADLILTMTQGHKAAVESILENTNSKVYTLAEFAGERQDVADPYGGTAEMYERCAAQIQGLLQKSWNRILSLAGKKL